MFYSVKILFFCVIISFYFCVLLYFQRKTCTAIWIQRLESTKWRLESTSVHNTNNGLIAFFDINHLLLISSVSDQRHLVIKSSKKIIIWFWGTTIWRKILLTCIPQYWCAPEMTKFNKILLTENNCIRKNSEKKNSSQ